MEISPGFVNENLRKNTGKNVQVKEGFTWVEVITQSLVWLIQQSYSVIWLSTEQY